MNREEPQVLPRTIDNYYEMEEDKDGNPLMLPLNFKNCEDDFDEDGNPILWPAPKPKVDESVQTYRDRNGALMMLPGFVNCNEKVSKINIYKDKNGYPLMMPRGVE